MKPGRQFDIAWTYNESDPHPISDIIKSVIIQIEECRHYIANNNTEDGHHHLQDRQPETSRQCNSFFFKLKVGAVMPLPIVTTLWSLLKSAAIWSGMVENFLPMCWAVFFPKPSQQQIHIIINDSVTVCIMILSFTNDAQIHYLENNSVDLKVEIIIDLCSKLIKTDVCFNSADRSYYI